jgi:DNA-binding PadR family transcriptional regulator
MRLTEKQIEQLRVICPGNPDGTDLDIDQILESMNYTPSKQSFQFSLRALINKGLVVKGVREVRRGRERQTITPTPLGLGYFPRHSLASILTAPGDEIE